MRKNELIIEFSRFFSNKITTKFIDIDDRYSNDRIRRYKIEGGEQIIFR